MKIPVPGLLSRVLRFGLLMSLAALVSARADDAKPSYSVLAFYTGKNDRAHISFVNEARPWFAELARNEGFAFESTTDWTRLNDAELSRVRVVLFLDTRPEAPEQRAAFQRYMERGGAWLGFHFAAFALTPSAYPQNWDWYHNDFLGSGQYASNTWRPTAATLRVEDAAHPALAGLPATFAAAPNEWYRWERDLRKNPSITVLLSIDPASFPLGTGPKPHEIWREGYFPVVWTNTKYRMLYVNMGHNDMDYGKTNRELSLTFANETQACFLAQALRWLASEK